MWIEKHGPGWRIREQVGGKKVTIESGYPTKTSAKAALTRMRADQMRGDWIDPKAGKTTLSQWIDAWWPSYAATLKPSAQRSEGSRVRIHIRTQLGHLPLIEVDALAVQQWVTGLSAGERDSVDPERWRRKPIAPKTVHNVHAVLHKILSAAVRQRLIRTNPAGDTGLPRIRRVEMRVLTTPEIGRVIASTPPHWVPLVTLLVATGLRYGEAIGLKAGRVDVLAGRLHVLETMHEAGGGEYIFTEPKSEQSRRTVTFPPEVGHVLAPLLVDKDRDDLVFTEAGEPAGRAVTRNFRTRVWARICSDAGVAGVRIHDLRHTHVAHLISAGLPLTAIQRRMGHASLAVTSDIYGHLLAEVDQGIVTAVSGMLPPSPSWGDVGGTGPKRQVATGSSKQ